MEDFSLGEKLIITFFLATFFTIFLSPILIKPDNKDEE